MRYFLRGEYEKMGKAIFFDIDGTLVNFKGKMPDSAASALKKAQENGHLIVLCTGRSVCQIYPFLTEMGFDGIVAASGAYVEYKNQVIFKNVMDEETLKITCALMDEAGAFYSAQAGRRIVIREDCRTRLLKRFREWHEEDENFSERINNGMEVEAYPERSRDIEKISFFDSRIPLSAIKKRLAEYCDVTAMSFSVPTDTDGEITPKGVNKALGIQKFIERAGIAREDTVAFGDGPNDFDMMEYVHTGVAMGNAWEEVKARASYVTKDIDDDGIAFAMAELGLV